MDFTILRFDTIDSTNIEALNEARSGAEEGLCVVARQQTKGRGRRGRSWTSEKDAGLYFSIVLRPKIEPKFLPLITLMAGLAVHDALAGIGLTPDIKWVNDLLIGGKKICGILAEASETSKGLAVVVGIGINLKPANYSPEIVDIATSIEGETGRSVDTDSLLEALTREIQRYYSVLNSQNGPAEIVHHWCMRSTYASGKSVRVSTETEAFTGITDGIEPNGALRIRTAEGVRIVQTGDVEQLRATAQNRER